MSNLMTAVSTHLWYILCYTVHKQCVYIWSTIRLLKFLMLNVYIIGTSDDKTRMELKYLKISKLERGKSVNIESNFNISKLMMLNWYNSLMLD